jgi:hypothetical protein
MNMKNILLALTLTASSAFAQQTAPAASRAPLDPRFNAWLGCWRLEDDLSGTGERMCITAEQGGVRLQTFVGSQKGINEVVIADGREHAIVDAECKGTERAEFSKDEARLFRTTEVLCGKEPPRIVKSIVFMAQGPAWINVQHVSGSAANTSVRVQRYRRSANQTLADGSKVPQGEPQAASAIADATTWSIDDVIEASGKMPAEAIQAALTEVHHKFDLNKKTLIALDEGGVHDSVIDLMVALTYPNKFVVRRAGESMSTPSGVITGVGVIDPFMMPMLMGAMADCYTPFGYGYRSYYSMCGYYPYTTYGYYGYGYPYYPYYGWVDVGGVPPGTGSGGGGTIQPAPQGRVVNGHGYTQIHDRQAEPPARTSNNGNGSGWSGSGSSGTASSGGYSSNGSSGGGSSGGGGDSGGARVAVPKGGGGQ